MSYDLEVDLGERGYRILVGEELLDRVHKAVDVLRAENRNGAVLTDEGVYSHQREYIEKAFPDLPLLVLPSGEETKALEHLGRVYDFLSERKVDRTGYLFAFGGGVVGDLGGFAAASYMRGIDYYQVPTTLLAMVDASVGGKTGINLRRGKNLVGAFYQPKAVFADTDLLRTLSSREFSSGMAEVIKSGLLADVELFTTLESLDRLEPGHKELPRIIHSCCAIKGRIVMDDERENAPSGGRALLNLGHTFGHAIEAVTNYAEYLHGEAVAVGMVLAARLSCRIGLLKEAEVGAISTLIAKYDLPVRLANPLSVGRLLEAMQRDKKVRYGTMRYIVLDKIGSAVSRNDAPSELVRELWMEAGAVDD